MVEILGTTVDAIHQASADGEVKYLVTADGVALMPTAQFPSRAGLVPQLGEMTARWVPCDRILLAR